MHRMEDLEKLSMIAGLVPEAMTTFREFDGTALAAGAIPKKYKELVALGIALTTQCPYCLELHREAAEKAGASAMELAEVVFVAAALRAGAAVTHGTHLLRGKVPAAAAGR